MAELLLKIGTVAPSPAYQDGDILCAFNSRRIRCCHAEMICHRMLAGGGMRVHRDNSHVARDWYEITHQYRFERVSRTEVRRVDLTALGEVILSGTPQLVDGKMQHMEVEEYLRRRLAHDRHKIFGSPGMEVWYGGRINVSNAKLDLVWAAIEAKTALKEVDHTRWPMGMQDLKSHLAVLVDDFDETEASRLIEGEYDITDPDNPVLLKKRRWGIDWKESIDSKDWGGIEDKNQTIDLRDTMTPLVRTTVVKDRSAVVARL